MHAGSAMHTHMSLFEGDVNAFHNDDDPLKLSDVGKSFIAGILEHASEISAVTNQWVNSYKRLVHGGEAPTAASLGGGQPLGAGAGADVYAAQDLVATGGGAQPGLGVQPVSDLRGAAGRRTARRGEGMPTPASNPAGSGDAPRARRTPARHPSSSGPLP